MTPRPAVACLSPSRRALAAVFTMTLSALSGLGAGCEASPGMALPAPRPGAAAITIVTHPAGAAVTVNGVPVGMGPVTVQLNPGPARVRATMSGYYPAQELSIVVERDAHATHELHLVASH